MEVWRIMWLTSRVSFAFFLRASMKWRMHWCSGSPADLRPDLTRSQIGFSSMLAGCLRPLLSSSFVRGP